MLDDILDSASPESLTHGLDSGLHNRIGGHSSNFLSSPSAAVSRARLNSNTTLGFLLPQPKGHFSKLKSTHIRPELSSQNGVDMDLLHKLEEQNSLLPPQDSTSFLLARLERQNGLLDTDPKSVCIESNVLKGNLNTLHRLIADSTTLNSPNSTTVDPMSSPNSVMEPQAGDEEIDWEFWGMLVQDYNAVASKLPHLLAARVRQGLPSKLRGLIWQSMSQASSTYLETMYTQLLKEHSPYERIIQRDLARTFPQVDMFKEEGGKGQEMLGNILKAYSLYDPHVGYCQGLGFLVGPLLMNMDEKEAFCVFVRLMETYDMRTMFTLNMEGLQLQGAPETIMRVAVALLKKNEEKLMQLQEFEDLLEALSSTLYEAYDGNAGSVIKDAMALSSVITKDKLDALAMSYLAELEDQQKRAGEVTSKRFRDRFGASKAKVEEKPAVAPVAATQTKAAAPAAPKRAGSRLSIAASFGSSASLTNETEEEESTDSSNLSRVNNTEAMLLEQIQELAKALSTLQRDNVDVTESLVLVKMEKLQYVEEVEILRKKVSDMERQQNRASVMSAVSPSVMSQSDTASTMIMSSPRTLVHEDEKMREPSGRPSSSWSTHSQEEDLEDHVRRLDLDTKASSISSLGGNEELVNRLAATERELSHVTSELVNAKVTVMEAMNEVESHRQKVQTIDKVLMDSKEAVEMLQKQHADLQDSRVSITMDLDTVRHERDTLEGEMTLLRKQFDETMKLWQGVTVERNQLQEKVKELEMNAAFNTTTSLNRGGSFRRSLGETTMMNMMNSRSGSPSPRTSTHMSSLYDESGLISPVIDRRSGESLDGTRGVARRGSSDTLNSTQSGRESTSSSRPAAMVRKGWPSEKAANAGVVPSSTSVNTFGTRKFTIDGEAKLKRSQSTRNSVFGSLGFRRSATDNV
ncbi:hypothetical protein BGW38_005027 [Lunasporangiospora selenospora]|uniref:Rab-GAP TBC domain-containing protein n=1 Tax=Lunasporangiospora selenospora TaxID=979761 RepID=A0A9P6FNY3_9FUNG|nr:hypothetical protein BGW38_005027 [Lunasporangiospora selenospora]